MGFLVDDADILAILKLGGVDEFNAELTKVNKQVKDGSEMLATAVNVGIAAGAAALGLAVKNAGEFERAMANVNTIANLDPAGMNQLSESVKQIAMVNPANMTSLTSGLYDLVSSGVPASDAANALAIAAQAASAGLTGVDTAIQAGMANINSYGLPVSELTRVFDLQFQAVNIGVLSYEQLATSIGNALPAAQNLKVPMDELYASIAQLTLSGIDPQSSATYLGRLFSQLADPEITGKIEANGIKVWGPDGTFRGLVAVLKDMDAAVKGMSDEQRANFFNSMGFTEQSNKAMLALVGNLNGDTGFLNTMEKMGQAPGAVNKAWATQMDTFGAQADKLKNIVQVGLIDLGNAFLPILKGIVTAAGEHPEATKTLAASIGTLAIGFAGIAAAAKGIAALQSMITVISASALGPAAIALGLVAAALVGINTYLSAEQAKVIDKIGATSEDVDKINGLADSIGVLRDKAELTKDESIKLKDAESDFGGMLETVGLKITDYGGNLDTLIGKYKELREQKLRDDLTLLQGKMLDLATNDGIFDKIGDVFTGAISGNKWAEQIDAINTELEELNKPEKVAAATNNLNALGNAAAGTDGTGGAAAKIKETKEQLAALKLAAEKEYFKEVKGMTGFTYFDEIQNKAMLSAQEIRGLSEALSQKDTGLIGKFPEVETGAGSAALKIGAVEAAALALSTGLAEYNPKLGTFVDNIWKIAADKKLGNSEIPGLFKSIGDAAGIANPKVGQLFGIMGSLAETGTNPVALGLQGISFAVGVLTGENSVKLAGHRLEEMTVTLGDMYQPTMDAAHALELLGSNFKSDRLDSLKQQQTLYTQLIDQMSRTSGIGAEMAWAKWGADLEKVNAEIESLTGAFTEKEKLEAISGNMDYLLTNTKEMMENFGNIDNPGLITLLTDAIRESENFSNTLDPTSKAFTTIADQIQKARDLLLELSNIDTTNIPVVMSPTAAVTPGQTATLHGGGFPVAHDGYLAPDETLVKMLRNEMVLRPAATAKFGASRLIEFNATLDPSALTQNGGPRYSRGESPVIVEVHEATPSTWARISDRHIQPRINTRTRKYEVRENPYAN